MAPGSPPGTPHWPASGMLHRGGRRPEGPRQPGPQEVTGGVSAAGGFGVVRLADRPGHSIASGIAAMPALMTAWPAAALAFTRRPGPMARTNHGMAASATYTASRTLTPAPRRAGRDGRSRAWPCGQPGRRHAHVRVPGGDHPDHGGGHQRTMGASQAGRLGPRRCAGACQPEPDHGAAVQGRLQPHGQGGL